MRISDWSSDVCSSDLNAAKLFCLVILVLAAPGRPVLAEGLPFALAEALDGGLAAAGTDEEAAGFAELGRFYLARGHRPLWVLEDAAGPRSEEHTSELQSLMRISYAVLCLTKKKTHTKN